MGKHAGRPATFEHELAGFHVEWRHQFGHILHSLVWVAKGKHRAS